MGFDMTRGAPGHDDLTGFSVLDGGFGAGAVPRGGPVHLNGGGVTIEADLFLSFSPLV
ncbi:hypothetical protein EYF80_067729 [Liparis tanakae]|uniref:Uncharacterized protein n=1 Tax=Liparis tanakae TaxID=230148 RepID=A0A4Z2E0B9_9TELE|nr:hypothetical protein EYF80_067729 [Liparis tanakae]